ncbi:hypothetical protein VT84_06340 [Gemmata sp. SH-PL17]|uniref:hypothetical protein n=1 Tax=Gemmata sp. SH-PL17 TaxID=1630693 RepID=UPI00078CD4C7|nr:hypothetical protein [Gemmata sp. SH-PL17]AMV23995.1 hypothetical protein VT84_06340 [Gemmata sp. SH-PL17]
MFGDVADKKESDQVEDTRAPGRNSNAHLVALLVTDDEGKVWFIPDGCFLPRPAGKKGEKARQIYFAKDDQQEVEIEIRGEQAAYVVDMIAAGKRASVRPGSGAIDSITITPVV